MKIRDKVTGEIKVIPGQQNISKANDATLGALFNSDQALPAPVREMSRKDKYAPSGIVYENLPAIGAFTGGFAGPVGAGAGYSTGDSLRKIIDELSYLGKRGGGEGGYDTGLELLSQNPRQTLQFAGENLKSAAKERGGDIKSFVGNNLMNSVITGFIDKIIGTGTKAVTEKLLPKINPNFEIEGILPKTVVKSAKGLQEKTFKPINEAMKKPGTVDITDVLAELEKRGGKKMMPYSNVPTSKIPVDVLDELEATKEVLSELTKLSDNGKISIQQAQDIASRYGKQTFSPATGNAKLTSDTALTELNASKKTAGSMVRKLQKEALESMGVKNVDEAFKRYGELANLTRTLERNPVSGALQAGVLGNIMQQLGIPIGGQAGALLTLGMMPYGRHLLREGVKVPIKALPALTRSIYPSIIDRE